MDNEKFDFTIQTFGGRAISSPVNVSYSTAKNSRLLFRDVAATRRAQSCL